MNSEIIISTKKSALDIDCIYNYLNIQSYWAQGRSKNTISKSIDNSLCFGVYDGVKQVGFARVVTDFAVFAWIMDVFIIDSYQGQGLGKRLMHEIISHPDLQGLQRIGLATDDAHGLYEKFGFSIVQMPEKLMEKVNKPS